MVIIASIPREIIRGSQRAMHKAQAVKPSDWIPLNDSPAKISRVCCIYALRNVTTGHRYIGSTLDAKTRFIGWRSQLTRNPDWEFGIIFLAGRKSLRDLELHAIEHARKVVPRDKLINQNPTVSREAGFTHIWQNKFKRLREENKRLRERGRQLESQLLV